MYLDFIFNKWEFTTFPDEIKETVMDMIYILIEHWVFNRVPVELFVDATNNLNTSNTSYIDSTLANNTQDMILQRVKALANFTELKNFLIPYNDENTVDANMIDLGLYYSKFVVDKLLEKEKNERIDADNKEKNERNDADNKLLNHLLLVQESNNRFTLQKQLKFFQSRCQDYTCPQNPNLRGPVTNLVIEEYANSDYEHETETLTVSFPKQIGTLPPNVLQPNPQEGDYTHATTADFSAKLQKQINILTNNFKLLQNSFIGTIAWFSSKKKIENGWFALQDKAYTIILAGGDELVTPSLGKGDFIRHNPNKLLQQQKASVERHRHKIWVDSYMANIKNYNFYHNIKFKTAKEMTAILDLQWINVTTRNEPANLNNNNLGYAAFKVRRYFAEDGDWAPGYSLNFNFDAKTKEYGENETRPRNTSLMAHIYVGLGARVK